MRRRTILACVVSMGTAAAAVACLTEPPGTTYGNPNSLVTASIDGSAAGPSCGGGEGGGGGGGDGGCPSFATDIFPTVANTWKCGDKNGCHGGTQTPPIDTSTAAKCLASLKAINLTENNQPYVGGDGGGQMLCNLEGTCGVAMPQINGVGAKAPTNDDLCKVQAWLKCGAPP